MTFLGPVVLLSALAVATGVTVAIAWWVLRPLTRAAKGRRSPAQFTLLDFLCLVFLTGLLAGVIRGGLVDSGLQGQWVAYGVGCICGGLLWWAAVRTLGPAGIRGTWQRAGFLAVVLPLTLFCAITFLVGTFAVLTGAFSGAFHGRDLQFRLAIRVEGGLLAILYGCGRYTRWLVARAAKPDGQGAPPASETPVAK